MTTDNNFRVKNGLTVGSGQVATDSGSGLGLLGPYIGVVSTSTGDIDLYTNNFTADGVEVWLQHNNQVAINTANGAYSWQFKNTGNLVFPDLTVQTTAWTGTSIATFLSVTAADTTTTNTATGIVLITDNGNHVAYYNSTVSTWLYVSNDAVVYSAPTPPSSPPVTDYIAWYDMSSVDISGMTWNDLSGNGYHATLYGSPSIAAVSGGGATLISSALTGSTGESAQFPIAVAYGPTYSLFTVSRWNGANHQRIYTNASNPTWLSGHHGSGAGVAYHGGWVNTDTDWFGTDWVINADQNYFYRPNGSTAAQGTSGSGDNPSGGGGLGINLKAGETSDWATVEVIAYDRTLTSGEIASVESYLADKYGITLVG